MHDPSLQRRRHTCRLRNAGRKALGFLSRRTVAACALLLCISLNAQEYPNGLSVASVNPLRDSLAIARVRARLDSVRRAEGRPTVALSLCGGGAKGAAEVGALQYIVDELHIPIDFIAGTSIGGLLGGVMSMGYTVDDLRDLFLGQEWNVLLSDRTDSKYSRYARKEYNSRYQLRPTFHLSKKERLRREAEGEIYDGRLRLGAEKKADRKFLNSLPSGYVYGFNVGNLLSSLSVGYQDSLDFCRLPVPFICTSSDLVSCRACNFSSGEIKTAMRATMSIPAMFSPVKTDGMVLADGGLQNNLPTDIAVAVGADYVIAIDISNAEAYYSDIDNVGDVLSQLIEISGRESYNRNSKLGDSYIRVNMDGYSSLDFDRESIDTMLVRGYKAARADSLRLQAIAAACRVPDVPAAGGVSRGKKATDIRRHKVKISGIRFRGMSADESANLTEGLEIQPGDSVDAAIMNGVTSSLQATGHFERVSYSLLGSGEPYELVFDCRQGPVHQVGVGLRLDSEEWMAVALNLGLNTHQLMGSKFDFSARVGSSRQNLTARYYYDAPKAPTFNVDANINQSVGDVRMGCVDGKPVSEVFDGRTVETFRAGYWSTRARIYMSNINWRKVDFNVGLQNNYYRMESSDFNRVVREIDPATMSSADFFGAFVNVSLYTMDDPYYASKGVDLRVGYQGDFCRIGNNDFKPVHDFSLDCRGVIPMGSRVALIPDFHHRSLLDDNPATFFAHRNYVGGQLAGRFIEQQIPYAGNAKTFTTTNHVSVLNLYVRTKILRNFYASVYGSFLHAAANLPDYFTINSYQDYSVGLDASYNSIIGPVRGSVFWSGFFGWGANISIGFDF